MKKVTVQELAANLEEHLAEVKRGETLTLVEEEQTIATIAPATPARGGVEYPFRDLHLSPRPKNLRSDPVEVLIEDREHEFKKHSF